MNLFWYYNGVKFQSFVLSVLFSLPSLKACILWHWCSHVFHSGVLLLLLLLLPTNTPTLSIWHSCTACNHQQFILLISSGVRFLMSSPLSCKKMPPVPAECSELCKPKIQLDMLCFWLCVSWGGRSHLRNNQVFYKQAVMVQQCGQVSGSTAGSNPAEASVREEPQSVWTTVGQQIHTGRC